MEEIDKVSFRKMILAVSRENDKFLISRGDNPNKLREDFYLLSNYHRFLIWDYKDFNEQIIKNIESNIKNGSENYQKGVVIFIDGNYFFFYFTDSIKMLPFLLMDDCKIMVSQLNIFSVLKRYSSLVYPLIDKFSYYQLNRVI